MAEQKKSGKGLLLLLLLAGGAAAALALTSKKTSTAPTEPPEEPIKTHKGCSGGKCIDVTGVGDDECSATKPCPVPGVSHKQCDAEGKCIVVSGAGDNLCSLDGDCPTAFQHRECDGKGKCVVVPGQAEDTCTVDGDCPEDVVQHNVCQSGKCIAVDGFAPNECFADGDCQPTPPDHHKECLDGECVDVFGFGPDECTSNGQCLVTHKACFNGKCTNVPGIGIDECTADGECSCVGFCGEIAPGGCSCKAGCEQAGNCCTDKANLCNETNKFRRVLIVACSSSLDDVSRGNKLKNNMIGGSNGGWKDGENVFTAFVKTLTGLSTIINDTNPEAIVLIGAQKSWAGCDFNLWQMRFEDVTSATDFTRMVQAITDGGILWIGLGGFTPAQTERITVSFTSYAGYVADEINFGTGNAPSNLLAFKPSFLSCEGSCGDEFLPPYCYCDTQCKNFGDCCYDYDDFCP